MNQMVIAIMKRLTFALMFTVLARPAFAQTVEDIEALSKWMEFEVVHYKIVGEFSGKTTILISTSQFVQASVIGEVTDRVEIEFDWNQKTHALVGTPIIRNSPTKLIRPEMTTIPGCPGSTKVDVVPEYLTGASVKADVAAVMGYLLLDGKRGQGTGSFPVKTDGGCGVVDGKVPVESVQLHIQAVSPTLLFFPSTNTRPSADKKSVIVTGGSAGWESGWTWTITPTAVK